MKILTSAAITLAASFMAIASGAHAGAIDTYYERAVMVAADNHCHLFSADLASALAAATAQAHGAALRSGADEMALDQTLGRAQSKAGAAPCGSPDIATAANRVRLAFDGYSKLQSMNYPGDTAAWMAQRAAPMRTMVWKLSQSTHFGPDSAVLGLAGRDGPSVLLAVASFADGAQPYTARLVVRDRNDASSPFLNGMQSTPGAVLPLASRMPPRVATTAFLPSARSGVDTMLLPAGQKSGIAFWYPRSASAALASLDPREAVAIDFLFAGSNGDVVRTAYFEVGDFAAGRAFLAANQR